MTTTVNTMMDVGGDDSDDNDDSDGNATVESSSDVDNDDDNDDDDLALMSLLCSSKDTFASIGDSNSDAHISHATAYGSSHKLENQKQQ